MVHGGVRPPKKRGGVLLDDAGVEADRNPKCAHSIDKLDVNIAMGAQFLALSDMILHWFFIRWTY